MRYTILFSIILFSLMTGCTKDKFKTIPDLKFSSVNTTELRTGQILRFTLAFTDAEGDISDSIFVEKVVSDCPASSFAQWYPLPSFPTTTNQKGDLIVTFGYNADPYPSISPQCGRTETAVFKFALRDKAKNISDTISSPPISIIY